jgi:hypothetical protein
MSLNKEGDWIYGFWRCELLNGSWLAILVKDKDGLILFRGRFRYYMDNKVWDSADEEDWYQGEFDTLESGIKGMKNITEKLAAAIGSEVEFCLGRMLD